MVVAKSFVVIFGSLALLSHSTKAFKAEWASNFATKTAYRNVIFSRPRFSVPVDCKLIAMDFLLRHGSRLPNAKMMLAIEKLHANILKKGDPAKVDVLQAWKLPYKPSEAEFLTDNGQKELAELARTALNWTGPLTCSSTNCVLMTTDTERTRESSKAFRKELGADAPEAQVVDKMLRFYDHCPKYQEHKNMGTKKFNKFKKDVISLKVNVLKSKFGLPAEFNLTVDDVYSIYNMCRFETASNNCSSLSPWCFFFDEETIDLMEYGEDLKRYWQKSYGYDVNYLQSCILVESMMKTIKDAAEEKSPTSLVFRFAHSTTVLQTATNLGLILRDCPPPTDRNFFNQTARHFRTSRFLSFAANLALQLLSCGPEGQLFVVPLMQEQSVAHRLCGADRCPLKKVLRKFSFCSQPSMQLKRLCSLRKNETSEYSGGNSAPIRNNSSDYAEYVACYIMRRSPILRIGANSVSTPTAALLAFGLGWHLMGYLF